LEEAAAGGETAAAGDELDGAGGVLEAGLAEGHDEVAGGGVVAHGVPVLAAGAGGAGGGPLVDLGVDDVLAVGDRAGLGIDVGEGVLEDGLGVAEEFAGHAVVLPEDAVFADGEDEAAAVAVDEDALEDLVEVE